MMKISKKNYEKHSKLKMARKLRESKSAEISSLRNKTEKKKEIEEFKTDKNLNAIIPMMMNQKTNKTSTLSKFCRK